MKTSSKERKAKIVVTIGPASEDEETIKKLIESGMNVARLNFSHGTHEQHAQRIERLRRIAHRLGEPLTILQDLQGPKIRVGKIENDGIILNKGDHLTLTTEPLVGKAGIVSVDFPNLPDVLKPGNRILLSDGQMELQVVQVRSKEIDTKVVLGGKLTSNKGVNLPGAALDIPCFTEKDEQDLAFGLEHGIDIIAMSFIRSAKDVERIRKATACLGIQCAQTPIIAKLERPESLDNLEEIVEAADGVMVARGDLAVEMSPQAVPIAQKEIITSANRHSKIVITATQMLESMISNPRPTRAEASDVANAIFDGTDAVMLSAETASGAYPVEAVQMMDTIIRQAEQNMNRWGHWKGSRLEDVHDDAVHIARAAREVASDQQVAAIAVFTNNGRTALLMSKERPQTPILAFTPHQQTYNRLASMWGVIPYLIPKAENVETMIQLVESAMIAETSVQPGQQVVLICGFPVNAFRSPNLILLHTLRQY